MSTQRPRPAHRSGAAARSSRLAAGALAVLLLAGCGGGDTGAGKEGSGSSRPESPPEATAPQEAERSGGTEAAADPGAGAPQPNQCFRLSLAQSRASVAAGPRVGCGKPHTSVVAHVEFLRRPVTPRTPVTERRELGQRVCAPAFRKLAGGTVADRASSLLTWTLFTPGRAQLEKGARWVRCDVLARSGDALVVLPATRPLLGRGVPEQLRVCQDAGGLDVSCSRTHAFRVAAVYRAADYPEGDDATRVARDRCRELTGESGTYWQPPSREGWEAGDRYVRCLERTDG